MGGAIECSGDLRKDALLIEGIYTALITPMKQGTVDKDALLGLVDRQLAAGVHGLVLCATTGEGSVLTNDERRTVIETAVRRVDKKIPICVGTGCISAWATVEQTRIAKDLGADTALVVSPAYVKPSQEGMIDFFREVADSGGLPIILYNVPSRTMSDIAPSTVASLSTHEKIVGIKEATGSMLRAQQVIAAAEGRIAVLSGDDPITLSLIIAGGTGVISTAANAVPNIWVSLWQACQDGDIKRAAQIQNNLVPLHEVLFSEANPGPVKGALHLLGHIAPEIRLPLTWPTPKTMSRLAEELGRLGVSVPGAAQ